MRGLRQAYGDKVSVSIARASFWKIGTFDVLVDGGVIFSKKDEKGFPMLEDIKKRLAGKISS